jgi:predicted transposase YbfD/YdcC
MENPISYFKSISEPRIDRCKLHLFDDILFLTIAAVICGADNFVEIEAFGNKKKDWLLTFLKLENGIPSHDTIGKLFARINPKEFELCFIEWMRSAVKLTMGQVIAIDGKTLRGSSSPTNGKKAIHMVSAFATANGVVLGQLACEEKSNEITAIPALLQLIVVKGCIVTIDAMGCQTNIAKTIIEEEADYILAVKDNQKKLHKEIQDTFFLYKCESFETLEKDHGRIETRNCSIIKNLKGISAVENWSGLKSIIKIESKQEINNVISEETRYYISSLDISAEKMNACIRAHWCVETKLHWILDVSFKEDDNRTRTDNSAENLSIVRRVALNLLKTESTMKIGIAAKRKAAGWDNEYLETILKL